MLLSSFITSCQAGLNQVVTNLIMTQANLIELINLGLTDIYTWHRWSWRKTIFSFKGATTGAVSFTYSGSTITRLTGSFITDGIIEGSITVAGTVSNNGTYTVQTVAAQTLTLTASVLTGETISSTIVNGHSSLFDQSDGTYKLTLTIPCDYPVTLINDTEDPDLVTRTEYNPANSKLLIEDNQYFIGLIDNSSLYIHDGFTLTSDSRLEGKFEYYSFFSFLTLPASTQTLPIPNSFTSALWNLVMSYATPAVSSDEQSGSSANYRQVAIEILKKHQDLDAQYYGNLTGNPY